MCKTNHTQKGREKRVDQLGASGLREQHGNELHSNEFPQQKLNGETWTSTPTRQ